MTTRSGLVKLTRAVPSAVNSGTMASPKSTPARLPDSLSSSGRTLFSVVPGGTVLHTATTGYEEASRRPLPTALDAATT